MDGLRELGRWLGEHRAFLGLATVGAYCAHWSAHGPPAHLALLPSLAVAVFLVIPLAAAIAHDHADLVARLLAGLGAASALAASTAWATEAQQDAIRADPRRVVALAVLALASVGLAAVRAGFEPRAWGLGLGDVRWWGPKLALALAVVAAGVVASAAAFPSFVAFYPRYVPARTAVAPLVAFELAMGLFAFAWEFFYRGFLLFGVARHGSPAAGIVLQVFPFFVAHLDKPLPELAGSWFGGLLIGWVAWRSRSIWPGFLLHWAQYSGMEVAAFALRQLA